jgi:hypothetical protein
MIAKAFFSPSNHQGPKKILFMRVTKLPDRQLISAHGGFYA